jgi:tripartite-type tricarboxylate transporter receptor subunit TctC
MWPFARNMMFGLLALGLLAPPAHAQADNYPNQPIKIVVPFAPGGSVDILARAVGQKLYEKWGQPVLVENRAGGSTMIGTAFAAKAPPDGYTLIIVVSNHATNPALFKDIPYDAFKSFAPVTLMARAPIVIFSHPSLPATNLKELIAIAKAKPGELNFGSAGSGSMTHMTAEMLKMKADIQLTHLPYRGGAAALKDLLGGHIPLQFGTVSQALPQYESGQLRALAISSAERYKAMPNVPTFKEQGVDVTVIEWYGLLAPAGTPQPIIAKLNAEVRRVLALPDLGSRVSSVELVGSTPEELGTFIRGEVDRWTPLIQTLNIKPE